MNVLIDFITLKWFTGAGEYQRIIFDSIKGYEHITIFALWDSKCGICYHNLKPEYLNKSGIHFVDIASKNINNIIKENQIDVFFIAAGQYLDSYYGIKDICCKVICTIHDIASEAIWDDNLSFVLCKSIQTIGNHCIKRLIGKEKRPQNLKNILDLTKNNHNCKIITPSEYTRLSLVFHYNFEYNDIDVLYTPRRITQEGAPDSPYLRGILDGKKYYLLLNANRSQKNVEKVIAAFKKYASKDQNTYLVTVQYSGEQKFNNHISIPFLSETDLDYALKHCYALIYASIYEGFGMPPLEAMKYGKPVLASNVTSIPEILGSAPIYFSPFYCSDILKAIMDFEASDYFNISKRSLERYQEIGKRQDRDLNKLINYILGT